METHSDDAIIPSSQLGYKVAQALSSVSEIRSWKDHPDAYAIQQEVLEVLESRGIWATRKAVKRMRGEIDTLFSRGKTNEVLALLQF